jgi:hypothetical protein
LMILGQGQSELGSRVQGEEARGEERLELVKLKCGNSEVSDREGQVTSRVRDGGEAVSGGGKRGGVTCWGSVWEEWNGVSIAVLRC